MTRAEIFAGVRDCLVAVIDTANPESIREETRIIGELGADSLDLLALTFHLEQRFEVKISPRDIEKRARQQLGDIPLEVDGVYTPEAITVLRQALPEIPEEELCTGLSAAHLPRLFRVATMVNLVSRLLRERDAPLSEEKK
jgi:acyl carrier protein